MFDAEGSVAEDEYLPGLLECVPKTAGQPIRLAMATTIA
jgi:hypothetical protein